MSNAEIQMISTLVSHLVEEDGKTPICGAEENWAEIQKLTCGVRMCPKCLTELSKEMYKETRIEITIESA